MQGAVRVCDVVALAQEGEMAVDEPPQERRHVGIPADELARCW